MTSEDISVRCAIDVAECDANLVAHKQRGIVGTKAHDAVDLECADTILTGEHQVHDAEPIAQRLVRILKNRADKHREAVAMSSTA
jgi:hypothetical protein